MRPERPPTIASTAAARWNSLLPTISPWLHEEVARRMEERLQWMTMRPESWLHWEPLRGGMQAHALLTARYPKAQCYVVHALAQHGEMARKSLIPSWWKPERWVGPNLQFAEPAQPVQMLWANMALHMTDDPQALLAHWHRLLEPNGFLMFSCLGPDTISELRAVYAEKGWPPASHAYTDMHDWGDMMLHTGFAEPVMDMERITLTFATPQRLLQELRELGRNLHPERFGALRGRAWHTQLLQALAALARPGDDGQLQVTFEIVYGHAFKAAPRLNVGPELRVSLDEMRANLRRIKKNHSPD